MSKTRAQARDKNRDIVLVTGATSSMGRRLVEELLKNKHEVRVLLKTHPAEHLEWKELPSGVRVYVADLKQTDSRTRKVLMEACKGVSVLFHLAAVTYTYNNRYSDEKINTNLMINTNVIGTENILQAYADANPTSKLRFIYTSSISIYGYRRGSEMLTEESEPKPRNAYAESKYMAEQVIRAFAAANRRLAYTILRMGVLYGPGYEKSFMLVFRLIKERKLMYVGTGSNHLTLITVDDAVQSILDAMRNDRGANRIYNVTDGVPYTQRQLFSKAAKFLNVEEPKKGVHPLLARFVARTHGIGGDQLDFLMSDRIVSIGRISKELGFRPSVSIDVAGKALAKEFLKRYHAR